MSVKIHKTWAMPNKRTFSIGPIRKLIDRYVKESGAKVIVDPFANDDRTGTIRNDLDPQFDTDYHLDAYDFLKVLETKSADMVLYDPPYSARQVSESYKKLGRSVNMETTQDSYWRKLKEQIARIVKPNGIVISLGWNSNGIGKKYGFEQEEILLVAHGSNHNDTIVVVEKKVDEYEE